MKYTIKTIRKSNSHFFRIISRQYNDFTKRQKKKKTTFIMINERPVSHPPYNVNSCKVNNCTFM